nr:RHS repeat-associated core domain-containing protein [Desulfobacula sp.]
MLPLDATGHTAALTDAGKTIVNAYAYTPFGVIGKQQETISQPFKFVGQYGVMAEDNGWYYMRARYYDPAVGRFISEDPLGFDGGDLNLYAYAGNNPVMMIDPWGLCSETLGWGAVLPGVGTAFVETYNAFRYNQDLHKGLEFGIRSTGVVIQETAKVVAQDVAVSLLNYIPLPATAGFVTGRGVSAITIMNNISGLQETANGISTKVEAIKNDIYSY